MVEGYRDVTRWLTDMAAPLTKEQPNLHGRGHKFDIPLVQATMARRISAAGGRVRIDVEVTDVAGDGDGFTLARSRRRLAVDGSRTLPVRDGGRQADPDVRRSLVEGGALVPPLRGNAFSRGDGAAIATALGGRLNTANTGFYGHLWALGVEPIAPFDFISFTFYQSEEGVMLDASGRRFADETRGDHNNTTALAAHGGHALLLWSEEVQERAGGQPFVGGSLPHGPLGILARPRRSRHLGGRRRGVAADRPGLGLRRGRGTFEDDVVRGRLGTGRIFAADVIPAVTMTFGGVEIDSSCRALDANGGPIAGLFAAGGDASDIYHRGYGGGLCAAAVTGRRAGTNAAELANTRA